MCLGNGETITKANGFLNHLESPYFLVAFKILKEVLTYVPHGRGVTLKLQMQAGDVFYTYNEVKEAVTNLKSKRSTLERELSLIFAEATKLGKYLHGEAFELSMPRINR